jgi:hypothetical protein
MTTATQIAQMLHVALGAALCWIGCFWLVREYRLSVFRQRLFEVRDELFDAAADGMMPFDHPAYRMTRQFINGTIRFAHRMNTTTLLLLLVTAWLTRPPQPQPAFVVRLREACQTLPTHDAQRRVLHAYHATIALVFAHITYASPILLPLFLVLLTRELIREGCSRLRQRVRNWACRAPGMHVLEQEAENYGSLG